MKKEFINKIPLPASLFLLMLVLLAVAPAVQAQDSAAAAPPAKKEVRLAKNTFQSTFLLDNQTVMVPKKHGLEMAIQHRFGTVNNGSKDMFGLFAPSNIRLGITYVPINRLNLGVGITKERMQVDLNGKYAILRQTENNKMPLSLSFYGNVVIDSRASSNFTYGVHRFSYFSQLLLARKLTSHISVQVAPSLSWFNNVEGYVDSKGQIQSKMHNYHVAMSFMGRYQFSDKSAIVINYDQPMTQHPTNNPHPNISLGFETTTDSHAFQVFAGNYYGIVPQSSNVYNQNDYTKGQFLIGFNITRLWVF